MKAFWSFAGRYWPPAGPTHELVAKLGARPVEQLHAAGVLEQVAIRPYESVRCPECWRDARVLYLPEGAVAVCTGDFLCPDLELGPSPSRSVMRVESFLERLAAALKLDGTPGHPAAITPLGRRRIGDIVVAFDFCPHPDAADVPPALAMLARRGPEVRVVLVPDSARLRADALGAIEGVDVVWAGLDEVVQFDGALRVDLQPVLARYRFPGAAAERPFDGLVLDASGASWRGRVALGGAQRRALQLLQALAARPGEWVSRRELWRAVAPQEFTKSGALPRGVNPDWLEEQLRQVVKEARAGLRAVGLDDALQNQRGDETKGGYRLALPAEAVKAA